MAMAVPAVVALPVGQAAAVTPGTYAYVANDTVSVIDTATVPAGNRAMACAIRHAMHAPTTRSLIACDR
ncbi:hypothetical protein [Streptomyces sp. NBC_01727]|uniref:hypothetical protein n=1 Tax=unclassified Streptomyces TaxID=2593676 RepID=UPI002E0F99E7|nr:hypothetical protein OIE76_22315 [Streptomyces sp. NBC_01727]